MANSGEAQQHYGGSGSGFQSYSHDTDNHTLHYNYVQYHDEQQDLFWPEPIEQQTTGLAQQTCSYRGVHHSHPERHHHQSRLSQERVQHPQNRWRQQNTTHTNNGSGSGSGSTIKRRPVNSITSTTGTTTAIATTTPTTGLRRLGATAAQPYSSSSTDSDSDSEFNTALSPVLPSPLRIRKPNLSAMPPSSAHKPVRLLIASIGNPPPYHTTRHSAGHLVLKSLATRLNLPPVTKSKILGSGSVSMGADTDRPEYTLWQSGSMMNVSGVGTVKAWKLFNNINGNTDASNTSSAITALVILHDELESPTGTVKLRRGESSPRGHNGIKSIQQSLRAAGMLAALGNERFIKIGIGISRPPSRDSHDVSAWVLGQLTQLERSKIEAATESLVAVLDSEIRRLEG
ncbi:hypothetical protein HRR95_000230 [Exophiala dermatitidis]|nr:hypothetical protein HRR75_000206 [Exophiala dermatitidis]KAJ4549926.1 hypothetical protein HRR78_004737 [Exophiala dermatitidis]KAJ4688864.1 hypothetical protein HRR95_000230 [Exophiala dermatitidis]